MIAMPQISMLQVALLVAFVSAIALSLVITPWVVQLAAKHGLYDNSRGGDRPPRRNVSRFGGVVIYGASVISMLIVLASGAIHPDAAGQRFLLGLLTGGTISFLLGLWDDIYGTSPGTKLIVQALAASVVFLLGTKIRMMTLGNVAGVETGLMAFPLTVIWIVGVTNAFNLIDGMDGLATGIGLVVLGAVTVAALVLGNTDVVFVSLLLVGALVGFLRYNIAPARIFLGDSGSMFIGFMLAVLSIHGSLKSTTVVLVAVPIFALAVPLLDATVAIGRRFLRGSPLFGADARHIHHRLLASGLTPGRASAVLCGVAAAFASIGLSIAFAPRPMLLGVALVGGLVTTALVMFGLRQLDYIEFIEAAVAIARRGGGVRKEIRDQIHARETVALLSKTSTLAELNALLDEHADRFGFVQLEVDREDVLRYAEPRAIGMPLLKLDYPLARGRGSAPDALLLLRIWSVLDHAHPAHGAERVARILAPAIDAWLVASDQRIPPKPSVIERRRMSDSGRSSTRDANSPTDAPWMAR
jgi:UDP-GlcNAc:undecaprenyl-phosphate/decaprenyl-phosphate GlcNAc-1-phosphate transferase